jgi:hypothetical protein
MMRELLKAGGLFVAFVPVIVSGAAAVWFLVGWILEERKGGVVTIRR